MKIYSAPLQGYTEAPWRNAHEEIFGGVDAYFTPFVRIERGEFRNKDIRDVDPKGNSVRNLIPQVIASVPNVTLDSNESDFERSTDDFKRIVSLFIEKGYKRVDINMGCPFPLITRKHQGSGIIPYPGEVAALMSHLKEYSDIEFSLKMRLGFENKDEWKDIIDVINDAPLSMVTLHPRIAKQQYKGDVDMESFDEFYHKCKHPLVYNGDLRSIEDVKNLIEKYPNLHGIMLGRGLLANPALALQCKKSISINGIDIFKEDESIIVSSENMFDETVYSRKLKEMHKLIFNHYADTIQENQVLGKMKAFWEYIIPSMDKKRGKAIMKSSSMKKYQFAVNDLFR